MHSIWIAIDAIKLPLFLLAFLAPIAGFGIGLASEAVPERKLLQQFGRRTGMGCLLGFVAAPVLLFVAMCTPPPGEGLAARSGRRLGATIMAALDSFRVATKAYPDSLTRLVPRYLAASQLRGPRSYPFEYHVDSAHFVLTFRYTGPGMNTCDLDSRERRWKCGGHY